MPPTRSFLTALRRAIRSIAAPARVRPVRDGAPAPHADGRDELTGRSGPHATVELDPARVHRVRFAYTPERDGEPDPGEVVWTWVPYEDDPTKGKDRPVLVVGRDGVTLHGLMLSSNADREGQAHWLALGAGTWDRQKRPSWVRLDRVLVVDEEGIRREGAVLDQRRFDAVAAELRRGYGWS
jgi:hypothetical protein